MLSITWLLFLLWMLSYILIIIIIDAKNLELNIIHILLGPLAIVYLLSIKSREPGMRRFYKSIEKGYWKKSAWKYYNDVISNIEDSSLTDDDLKKLELYIDVEMSNSKFRTNVHGIILGICVTCMVAFSVYTLTGMDTQEQQRIVDNKEKGITSSSTITIHSMNGKEKTYDTHFYFKKQIITTLVIPILIFSFLLFLQTINISRNSIISNAIKFKLFQGDNERQSKVQGNNLYEGSEDNIKDVDEREEELRRRDNLYIYYSFFFIIFIADLFICSRRKN